MIGQEMKEFDSEKVGFFAERSFIIEWGQCDPAGIVYYPRYFDMFNESTIHLFAAAGYPKHEMLERFDMIGYPMIATNASFHLPSTFGDTVTIRSFVAGWGRSSFEIRHDLLHGSVLAVAGYEKRVWAARDLETQRIRGVPAPREVVERMMRAR